MDKERFVPSPQDTRSTGEHGQSCTFLHHGFQEWILASLHGPGVTTVHRIHGWQPWFLSVYQDALWTVQHAHNVPAFDAEYTGRAQSDVLHYLPGSCDCIWAYRRRTPQASTSSIWVL